MNKCKFKLKSMKLTEGLLLKMECQGHNNKKREKRHLLTRLKTFCAVVRNRNHLLNRIRIGRYGSKGMLKMIGSPKVNDNNEKI